VGVRRHSASVDEMGERQLIVWVISQCVRYHSV